MKWRANQAARVLISVLTLAFFVGVHEVLGFLFGIALKKFPLVQRVLDAASAVAFLTIGVILLVEMVQVFVPWGKMVKATPQTAHQE
jgi:uncharacterized membrane protein (Fun14 family)